MSRVARLPVVVPEGVTVSIDDGHVHVKGRGGFLKLRLHRDVALRFGADEVVVTPKSGESANMAIAGTMRALIANMVAGVSRGFERRLQLVGVGFRAQVQGGVLNLSVGYSHPVSYVAPEDVSVETPSHTEVVVRGADKQRVGQVAAQIREFRPPERYKGKGVRYLGERVILKEAKKK